MTEISIEKMETKFVIDETGSHCAAAVSGLEEDDLEPFDYKKCMDHLSNENWEEMVRVSEEHYEMEWAHRHVEQLNPYSDFSF